LNIYIPPVIVVFLTVASAVDAFLLTQSQPPITGAAATALGAVQVAITAILGFQKTAINTVRRLRGKPTLA
jgi:hypothetical protein